MKLVDFLLLGFPRVASSRGLFVQGIVYVKRGFCPERDDIVLAQKGHVRVLAKNMLN